MTQDLPSGGVLPSKEITVKEIEELCGLGFSLREEIKELEEQIKDKEQRLAQVQESLLLHLQDFDKDSYESSLGKISIRNDFYVSVPKEPEAREAFFDYLKNEGDYDNMITVNSRTLTSYYKEKLAEATQKGDLGFAVPGIGEPFMKQTIVFRKKG
jgi:hypothetical protein